MEVPTVAIHHPADREVRMVINASDFVEGQHVLWTEPREATGEMRIQRGARGLWFVRRDGEAIGPGHKSEAEARAAMEEMPR